MEIDILILISFLTRVPWKKLYPPYWEIFKIRITDWHFRSPEQSWLKNEKKKKNKGNCEALCVSRKRKNTFFYMKNVYQKMSLKNKPTNLKRMVENL